MLVSVRRTAPPVIKALIIKMNDRQYLKAEKNVRNEKLNLIYGKVRRGKVWRGEKARKGEKRESEKRGKEKILTL